MSDVKLLYDDRVAGCENRREQIISNEVAQKLLKTRLMMFKQTNSMCKNNMRDLITFIIFQELCYIRDKDAETGCQILEHYQYKLSGVVSFNIFICEGDSEIGICGPRKALSAAKEYKSSRTGASGCLIIKSCGWDEMRM